MEHAQCYIACKSIYKGKTSLLLYIWKFPGNRTFLGSFQFVTEVCLEPSKSRLDSLTAKNLLKV